MLDLVSSSYARKMKERERERENEKGERKARGEGREPGEGAVNNALCFFFEGERAGKVHIFETTQKLDMQRIDWFIPSWVRWFYFVIQCFSLSLSHSLLGEIEMLLWIDWFVSSVFGVLSHIFRKREGKINLNWPNLCMDFGFFEATDHWTDWMFVSSTVFCSRTTPKRPPTTPFAFSIFRSFLLLLLAGNCIKKQKSFRGRERERERNFKTTINKNDRSVIKQNKWKRLQYNSKMMMNSGKNRKKTKMNIGRLKRKVWEREREREMEGKKTK